MPGGCWICNPMCGKCQPAPMRSAKCPECGKTTVFERPNILARQGLVCKWCKADMEEVVVPAVVRCNYSGKLCAYPCGKSTSPKHERGDQPCERNTPPDMEYLLAHKEDLKESELAALQI